MPKVIDLPTATTMDDGDYLIMEESSGGTKKITRKNAMNLGAVVVAESTLESIPSNSYTNMCSMTLTTGTWLVVGQTHWSGRGVFNNVANISSQSATAQITYGGYMETMAGSSGDVGLSISKLVTITGASQTVYLVGWQNSGSAKSIGYAPRNNMRAIRLQ